MNRINLLRWSLKHRIAFFATMQNMCKSTPLEFETRPVGLIKSARRRVNLLRWSLKR